MNNVSDNKICFSWSIQVHVEPYHIPLNNCGLYRYKLEAVFVKVKLHRNPNFSMLDNGFIPKLRTQRAAYFCMGIPKGGWGYWGNVFVCKDTIPEHLSIWIFLTWVWNAFRANRLQYQQKFDSDYFGARYLFLLTLFQSKSVWCSAVWGSRDHCKVGAM